MLSGKFLSIQTPKQLPGSGNTSSINVTRNLEDLQKAKEFAAQYGYELPKNLERIAQSDVLTDRTIRGMMNRHNTFARGVSTNWDELADVNPEILKHLESKGIDWKNNPKEAAEYMATHIPINTGYGRVGIDQSILDKGYDALYTSNSVPTGEGYTYGQGHVVLGRLPVDYSSANRLDWINVNNPPYYTDKLPLDKLSQGLNKKILRTERSAADNWITRFEKLTKESPELNNIFSKALAEDQILLDLRKKYPGAGLNHPKPISDRASEILNTVIEQSESLSKINKSITDNPYAHYIHIGTPGEKILDPVKSFEITPQTWINRSRAHSGTYTPKLSKLVAGGPRTFQNGGPTNPPTINQLFQGVPPETVIEKDPITGEELFYTNPNAGLPPKFDYKTFQRGVSFVESKDGKYMKNPNSSATGLYGQLYNEVKNLPELEGISRDDFAADTALQNKILELRVQGKISGIPGIQESAETLYNQYSSQIPNFPYNVTEVGAFVNFLGRQGTRKYFGRVLRDKENLGTVFPNFYGENVTVPNKTPEQYITEFRTVRKYGGPITYQTGGLPGEFMYKSQSAAAPLAYNSPTANGYLLPDPNRPELMNTGATEYKMGVDDVTIPTVVNGQYMDPETAYQRYKLTGEKFKPTADPSAYSKFYDEINKLGIMKYKKGGPKKYQAAGPKTPQKSYYSHRDSVDHQADKILQYEQLKGGPGGIPLPSYSDPKYKSMIMDYILPEVDKIMPNASAMEKSEAIDFVFNAGWDKSNNTIKKDPRAYAIQEYYRKFDPSKLDKDGKWAGRKNAPYSFDQEYDSTIGKLSENERRILMNKGRDWYYQNINNPSPGVPSSDYYDTWYGRIWNTNDFSEFNPNK
jgi:hypothetical protein